MNERIHSVSPERSNLQISGPEEKKIDKTQLTTQIDEENNKLEQPKLFMKTSLDNKSNLYSIKKHISEMGKMNEKNCVCISEENTSCVLLSDKEIQKETHHESYPESEIHVKPLYDTEKEETESLYSRPSQISYSDKDAKYKVLRVQDSSHEFSTFEDSRLAKFDFDKECPEDGTPCDSNDTMKECLQILDEFTETEAHKGETAKQASRKQMELDMLYSQNTSGPKKRIAHSAKFNVPARREITDPIRVSGPPLMSHPGILQAQQQAMQITAAIRSGQAFIAATLGQRKNTFACQAPQTQRKASGENPLTSSNLHLDVLLSKEIPTAKPSISHIPVRSVAAFPVKVPKSQASHRKKASVTSEPSSQVPDEVRHHYTNLFVEKYLIIYKSEGEALNKAKLKEKAIYERCGSRNMYVNLAINTLRKLTDQDVSGNSDNNKITGLKKNEKKNVLTGIVLYRHLKRYLLTEEQLQENNYPQPNPDKPGSILLRLGRTKILTSDASKKICCRCGEIYGVTPTGKYSRVQECNYHSGPVLCLKVPGGLETRYSCCEGVPGSPGCQVAKLHVHDQQENLEGFVKTFARFRPHSDSHGVFAMNCEMCYTAKGLELTRVTVVDPSLRVVYDTFVKPEEEVIDYNTRFSGVVEDDLKNTKTSIHDVQAILLNLFSADTVLIGHSFEYSLYALKLIHTSVVDTTVLFPHRLGLPHKRSLKSLVADYLQRIIQDDGHSSSENAAACMELVLWKVKEDLKGRK
ncbi:RNA exonuclease 1 [Manis javanica]|nr:RNA exonuclease 1 [Manis javanica]